MDGIARFLLQTNLLDVVVLIEAQKGDIILIPPGYGHVTINPTPGQTLTFVQSCFNSGFKASMHGMITCTGLLIMN